jgi:dTDP-4-dehydrorhamnose 3,5-epimerase
MPFIPTHIDGLIVFEPQVFEDSRGYFFEAYNEETFKKEGLDIRFVQDNQSFSTYGVIRGLHYQLNPYAQTKLIRTLQGVILDVVVDLRKGSPSFGQSFSLELSAQNRKQLLVPKGFAHGYSVLSESAVVMYKCDATYHKETEAGIRFDDTTLNIDWQIPKEKAIISGKDLLLPKFNDSLNNFEFNG